MDTIILTRLFGNRGILLQPCIFATPFPALQSVVPFGFSCNCYQVCYVSRRSSSCIRTIFDTASMTAYGSAVNQRDVGLGLIRWSYGARCLPS